MGGLDSTTTFVSSVLGKTFVSTKSLGMSRVPVIDHLLEIKTEVILHVQSSTVQFPKRACKNAIAAILFVDETRDEEGIKEDINGMIEVLDPKNKCSEELSIFVYSMSIDERAKAQDETKFKEIVKELNIDKLSYKKRIDLFKNEDCMEEVKSIVRKVKDPAKKPKLVKPPPS